MPMNNRTTLGRSSHRTSKAFKPGNPIQVRELTIFIDNDSLLDRQRIVPIKKNQVNKLAAGVFDKEKSVKLFRLLADEGARRYNKEFGTGTLTIPSFFDTNDRQQAAKELAADFLTEANLGNFDEELNKKNKGAIWPGKRIQAGTMVTFTPDKDADQLGLKKGQKVTAELVRSQATTGATRGKALDTSEPLTITTEVMLRLPNKKFARVPVGLVKEKVMSASERLKFFQ